MIHFKLVVLKDTSKSLNTGALTTFVKAVIPNGPVLTSIAGFVPTSSELKVGQEFDMTCNAINVRKSKEAVEIDGEQVYFDWLEIV